MAHQNLPAFSTRGTALAQYPKGAKRESYERIERTQRGSLLANTEQYQLVLELVFSVDVVSESTAGSIYDDYIRQHAVASPKIYVGNGTTVVLTEYTGDWIISRVSCIDHMNGASTVTTTCTYTDGLWYDAEGNVV